MGDGVNQIGKGQGMAALPEVVPDPALDDLFAGCTVIVRDLRGGRFRTLESVDWGGFALWYCIASPTATVAPVKAR